MLSPRRIQCTSTNPSSIIPRGVAHALETRTIPHSSNDMRPDRSPPLIALSRGPHFDGLVKKQ